MFSANVRESPLDAKSMTLLVLVGQSVAPPSIKDHALQSFMELIHLLPSSDPLSLRAVVIFVRLV